MRNFQLNYTIIKPLEFKQLTRRPRLLQSIGNLMCGSLQQILPPQIQVVPRLSPAIQSYDVKLKTLRANRNIASIQVRESRNEERYTPCNVLAPNGLQDTALFKDS
jgi:hypothetical protein